MAADAVVERLDVVEDREPRIGPGAPYGTGGEVLSGTQGNGNTLVQSFDAAGHLLERETRTGGTSRAHDVYTYNRAGQVLSENSTLTGDPANGAPTTATGRANG